MTTSTSMFLNVPLILISSLGIIFNGYTVTAVLLTRQVTSANNILLLHLGIIDVLLGILFLIFSAPGYYTTKPPAWLSETLPCLVHGFMFTLLHPLALWTICGLNCDRYYAIAAPLHYSHLVNRKKALIGLSGGWIISVLLCIPPLFEIAPYRYIRGLEACAPDFASGPGTLWYSTLFTAFTLLLPATIIICCNLKILMIARYHRHRIASAIYEVTLSAQVTITHQRNPFFVPTVTSPASGGPPKVRGRSAIYTVLQIIGSLGVLYLPYYSLIIWEATTGSLHKASSVVENHDQISNNFKLNSTDTGEGSKGLLMRIHPNFFKAAMIMLICSPSVNGFLYGVKSKPLRKIFQNYWRKKQTKSEVNQEIQARTPSTCGSRRPSLTPLGFLQRPTLQRRLSEAFLDVHKAVSSPQRHKIKRITTDLTWRPGSANSLNFLSRDNNGDERFGRKIKQTASCNTLQVPSSDTEICTIIEDEMNPTSGQIPPLKSSPNKMSPANLLFQKFFWSSPSDASPDYTSRAVKRTEVVQNILDGTPTKRSPRITITRTYSEESSDNSRKDQMVSSRISKKHSNSSATLFDKKWRLLREAEVPCNSDSAITATTTPLLLDNSSTNGSSGEESNSDTSDCSSGKIFMTLDMKSCNEEDENDEENCENDLLLMSWNKTNDNNCYCINNEKNVAVSGSPRPHLTKQISIHSSDIVLH